jgi:nuclear transcription Y subunit beta
MMLPSFDDSESKTDQYHQTQSTRGEQRPSSQGGYGATGASGGAQNAASSTFPGGADTNNSILGGQQAESGGHDPEAYGSLYGAPGGHNNGAAGGDGY